MEEVQLLSDVIGILLGQGYTLGFEAPEQGILPPLPATEFNIDEIYRCREYPNATDTVYVFAVSAAKYNLKGIVINLMVAKNTFPLREAFQGIRSSMIRLWTYCRQ